jgi:hypothetical protein
LTKHLCASGQPAMRPPAVLNRIHCWTEDGQMRDFESAPTVVISFRWRRQATSDSLLAGIRIFGVYLVQRSEDHTKITT